MDKKELLGAVRRQTRRCRPKSFDPRKVLRVIKTNGDYENVPHYCKNCGITTYIPQKEANSLFLAHGKGAVFPAYTVGVYIENSSCPRCSRRRGKNPRLKSFSP